MSRIYVPQSILEWSELGDEPEMVLVPIALRVRRPVNAT